MWYYDDRDTTHATLSVGFLLALQCLLLVFLDYGFVLSLVVLLRTFLVLMLAWLLLWYWMVPGWLGFFAVGAVIFPLQWPLIDRMLLPHTATGHFVDPLSAGWSAPGLLWGTEALLICLAIYQYLRTRFI